MAELDIKFYSQSLVRKVSFRMIIPNDNTDVISAGKMKTLFLLHGYTGCPYDWNVEQLARRYNFAAVMPDGENSFYLDGASTTRKYCTFVGSELVDYVRKTFGLALSAEDTCVCGYSMGGFGALHTALAYPDNFGMAGAMSSALIIHQIAGIKAGEDNGVANYDYYRECFGEPSMAENSDANPETLVKRLKSENKPLPEIYMCCGTEDFLLEPNRDFHRFLENEGVGHVYKESPGAHDWGFWGEYTEKIVQWMFG